MPRSKGQLRQGIRYAAGKPSILWPLVMLAFLSVFSLNMPVILASYATDVFAVGAGGYGLFNSLVAAGALAGALASTRAASVRLRGVIMAGGAWGLLQAGTGFMAESMSFGMMLVLPGTPACCSSRPPIRSSNSRRTWVSVVASCRCTCWSIWAARQSEVH